ncbi:MAG TPA: Hsp20/alpha crystallin family protein [Bacteroidetes bacterium]|nr:Hsp20/alpha crystallin family protein [Bacteroidota bacterium]
MSMINLFPATVTTRPSSLLDTFFNMGNSDFPVSFSNGIVQNSPAVNIMETDNNFRIELAAPGFNKNDFEVKVDQGLLTISGRKEVKNEDTNEQYTRREFNYVEFTRNFQLPESVNPEAIKAGYENGILHVVLDKKDEAKPQPVRTIKIK